MEKYTLIWNDELHNTGIASLDRQHREIVNLVNQIAEKVANGSIGGVTRSLVEDLLRASQTHFALEDELMVEYGFPDIHSHVEKHDELLLEIKNLADDIVGSKRERAELISAYLNNWVEIHIIKSDRDLGNFLVAKGLS